MKHFKRKATIAIIILSLVVISGYLVILRGWNKNPKTMDENTIEVMKEENESISTKERKPVTAHINHDFKGEKFPVSYGRDIVKGRYKKDGKKVVFLTFDDGPSLNNTPKILDTLDKNQVRGTFFLIGKNIDKGREYQDVVRKVYSDGHAICSHGYTHDDKNLYPNGIVNIENLKKEIDDTDKAISTALGIEYKCKVFRFPYGEITRIHGKDKNINKAIDELNKNKITSLDWTSLTEDSVGKQKTKEELMKILKRTSKGKEKIVILLHDSDGRADTADMIQDIIDYFKSQGYIFGIFDI